MHEYSLHDTDSFVPFVAVETREHGALQKKRVVLIAKDYVPVPRDTHCLQASCRRANGATKVSQQLIPRSWFLFCLTRPTWQLINSSRKADTRRGMCGSQAYSWNSSDTDKAIIQSIQLQKGLSANLWEAAPAGGRTQGPLHHALVIRRGQIRFELKKSDAC